MSDMDFMEGFTICRQASSKLWLATTTRRYTNCNTQRPQLIV
jgi:hypothetical protein